MGRIKFGTDGWRAVIAEDFTFANLDRVTQATADYWKANAVAGTEQKVIVGYDRRFLSDQFGRRVAEIFAGNGYQVVLTSEPTPTPAVSFAVKDQKAIGGVMITASHNPPAFNGYKLKAFYGGPADPTTCSDVETFIDRNPVQALDLDSAVKQGRAVINNIRAAHYKAIKKLVNFKLISKSKLRFAHEALFGVGAGCFDELLAGTTCRVTTLNANHDPLFGGINPEPIARNYVRSAAYLKKHPHDICLVTDGDADRVGGMDGRGNYLSTHQLICLLLHHFVVNRKGRGRVVKALTTTSMVDKMCAAYNLPLVETGVGFKYICSEMLKGDVLLGAEESGGIGFPGHIPERDGILAGLMLLELLATEKTSITKLIANLEKQFGPHRYGRIDAHFPLEKRASLMDYCAKNPPSKLLKSPVVDVKAYDGVKFVAQDGSWLMLRGSGTEPILRIYAEARTDADAQKLLRAGVEITRKV
ncbi:phosphoglucomutase/phosphomannomutase family protein [Pedosphaera parvula]|uniref:Phosphoglucomutase n=1 Tax=Pedosphaera parvula (strain Ellin514) TaxID=320771 RepID=B9XGF7_PEDPL|nr:phosphoglucomutase/phosphomannomutase family protein [Pedosphaera parvula]EEF61008.1 Phosphoglucomutase [Pedosphaera parvula Ellin514]